MRIKQFVITAAALLALCSASWAVTQPPGDDGIPGFPGGNAAYLGVRAVDVTHEHVAQLKLKEESGVEVLVVDRDAPAGKAGIQEHDVILSFNGSKVESEEMLRRLVRETPVGRKVTLALSRDGQALSLEVTLAGRRDVNEAFGRGHMPPMPPMPGRGGAFPGHEPFDGPSFAFNEAYSRRTGILVEALTPQLAEYFGISNGKSGVLVGAVEKDSAGAAAGLKAGDIILEANKQKIDTPNAWHHALRNFPTELSLQILRDRHALTVTLKLPEHKRSAVEPQGAPEEEIDVILEGMDRQLEERSPMIDEEAMAEAQAMQQRLPQLREEMNRRMDEARKAFDEASKSFEEQTY